MASSDIGFGTASSTEDAAACVQNSEEENDDKTKTKAKDNYLNTNSKLIDSWREIQDRLRTQIIAHDTEEWQQDFTKLKYVAGLDISIPKDDSENQGLTEAFAAIAIFSFPQLKPVYQYVQPVTLDRPYVPAFLAFRESPAVCQLIEKVLNEKPELKPDVLLIDGNGILHPQRCGLACHIGLKTNIPTVGVAKNLFHIAGLDIPDKATLQRIEKAGNFIELRSSTDDILGMALKTSDPCKNPVYVSIGHKISLETARKVVLALSKFRVPDPIRVADRISREAIAAAGEGRIRENPSQTRLNQ